jgi:hypothetical protein
MYQRCNVLLTKRGVTSVNEGFQVVGGDLGGRYIQAEDFESQLLVGEVFPAHLKGISSLLLHKVLKLEMTGPVSGKWHLFNVP